MFLQQFERVVKRSLKNLAYNRCLCKFNQNLLKYLPKDLIFSEFAGSSLKFSKKNSFRGINLEKHELGRFNNNYMQFHNAVLNFEQNVVNLTPEFFDKADLIIKEPLRLWPWLCLWKQKEIQIHTNK